MGIPHRLVITEKNLQGKSLQYKGRIEKAEQIIKIDQIVHFLNKKIPTLDP
jgi:histidinol phosphatase-like PHP family hydrolase